MLYLVEAPQGPVVELDEMKQHLNAVDFDDDDDLIQAIERAAAEKCEAHTGRAFIERTYQFRLDSFPCGRLIRLPKPPLIAVESLSYVDADSVAQTFAEAKYHVIGAGAEKAMGFVRLKANESWATIASDYPEAIVIEYRAGYLDTTQSPPADNVPESIRQAVKLLAGHLYANRESVVIGQTAIVLPQAVEWLLEDWVSYGAET